MKKQNNFNKSADENIRDAFLYAKDSIMLPESEIGSDVYMQLIAEKAGEYFRIYGA